MRRFRTFALLLLMTLVALCGLPAAAQTTTCEAGFYLFDHKLLATEPLCIPENPQRIAFLDTNVAYSVALGVPSITDNYYYQAFLGDFPGLRDEKALAEMVDVGNTWEMNAESLLIAKPDLIISTTWLAETNELIAPIAPLVILDQDRAKSWRETLDAIAQLTKRTERAAELVAQVDERIAVLNDMLQSSGKQGETYTVSIIETGSQLWAFTSLNFGAEIAHEAGLTMADSVPTPEEANLSGDGPFAAGVSLEDLPMIDADHIFLFTNFGTQVEEDLFATPVWQAFAATNPDRIHFLSSEYWVRDNPFSAHRVLDDLFTYIAGVDPAEVSPNPFAYAYQLPEAASE